jgi:hypothetical protein
MCRASLLLALVPVDGVPRTAWLAMPQGSDHPAAIAGDKAAAPAVTASLTTARDHGPWLPNSRRATTRVAGQPGQAVPMSEANHAVHLVGDFGHLALRQRGSWPQRWRRVRCGKVVLAGPASRCPGS